jgi:3-oxoisoapionate kinase
LSIDLPFAFYGDDFTGSTDALEFLSRYGMKTLLFIDPPTLETLAQFDDIQAIGVAGSTRSMAPEQMETTLRSHLGMLKKLGCQLVHYKVCSTFDSSPTVGSIGKAIDVGIEVFGRDLVPVIAGAPHLGRFSVFGNLFARLGIGSDAEIYRLDRHPVMMHHPVTPTTESDLCLHLGAQCDRKFALLNLLELRSDDRVARMNAKFNDGCEVMVIDGMTEADLKLTGALIVLLGDEKQGFVVGSSGVEVALGLHWNADGICRPVESWSLPEAVDQLLVISGSCSPVTEGQIEYALESGFEEVVVSTERLVSGVAEQEIEIKRCIEAACKFLKDRKDIVIHTAKGKHDPRIQATRDAAVANGISRDKLEGLTGERFGSALGRITAACLGQHPLRRLVIAGGDSSSFAARALEIRTVEMLCPMVPGAPLCRVIASAEAVNGLEVNFKGGQVGKETYFVEMKKGRLAG